MPVELDNLKTLPVLPVEEVSSFSEASQVYPTADSGRYTAYIPPDWTFGPNAHGGLSGAILIRAVQLECDSLLGENKLPHAISTTFFFFNRARVGAAEVRVQRLNIHTATSVFRSSLYQNNKLCVEATVTQSNLDKPALSNLSLPTPPVPHFASMNVANDKVGQELDERGWVRLERATLGIGFYKHKPQLLTYFEPGTNLSDAHIPHTEWGRSVRDCWWTGIPWDGASLRLLLDLSVPLHWNYPEGNGYFVATQSATSELRMKPPVGGWTWLFQRTVLRDCTNGTYVSDITLVNEKGETVALGTNVYALIPIKRIQKSASSPNIIKVKETAKL